MTRLTNALFLEFNRDIYRYDIEYIPIPDEERRCFNQFETYWKFWPKNIFLKLFLSRFLSCDKCIYLDGDTVCVSNIRRLWNTDLGEYCFGGTMYSGLLRYKEKIFNAGMLLFNLKKMGEVNFATEIEEILKEGQRNPKLRYLEEYALKDYSKKYGYCKMGDEFNMIVTNLPRTFHNENEQSTAFSSRISQLQLSQNALSDLAIIHYCWFPTKPWSCIQKYEAAGCPSYEDTKNNFWKTTWTPNPWAFIKWYEHYKKYREIENLSNLD
jgi:lipopolysaccharide biosynthesis glycosyltransferase